MYKWPLALAPFYLFFTPACGVMYKCGCRPAWSKWLQVKTCNVFDPGAEHRCPWCSCKGGWCLFVASDTTTFKEVFLFDLLPDGFCVTVLTVGVLFCSWRKIDPCLSQKWYVKDGAKIICAWLWFVVYCLVLGFLFFQLVNTDYPYFLGREREPPAGSSTTPGFSDIKPTATRFLVTASELNASLDTWVVLDARGPPRGGVVPGAIAAPWKALSEGGNPESGQVSTLLPPGEAVARLMAAGANGSRRMAVYGSWDKGWGEEGRLFWTLEYLGLAEAGLACLDGGIEAWRAAGLPEADAPAAEVGPVAGGAAAVAPAVRPDRRATTKWVRRAAEAGGAVFLDTRDREEFEGAPAGDPYGAARSGHIPGAVWWPWREHLFGPKEGGPPQLRPCVEVLASLPAGAGAARELVAYCTGGIRSGFAYFVLRGCGLGEDGGGQRVRNYDGSWWSYAANSSLACEGAGPGCSAAQASTTDAGAGAGGPGGGSGGGAW